MGSNEIETLTREMAMKAHELNHQMYVDARKSAIDSANIALKAMLLINGGAVVALLAFLGSTNSSSEGSGYFSALVHPISLFAWGVGFSALTAVLSYLVNMLDSDIIGSRKGTWAYPFLVDAPITKKLKPVRTILHILALGVATGSLVAFIRGVVSVTDAITN